MSSAAPEPGNGIGIESDDGNKNTGSSTDSKYSVLAWLRERSELGMAALLAGSGALVIVDALTMSTDFTQRGPVGPKAVPLVVGVLLLVVAVVLSIDVLRGGRGEAEAGEDIDLDSPLEWRTVLLLVGVFVANIVLIDVVGFPIAGALLFWGAAFALGSRHWVRDPVVAISLALITYAVFVRMLGVALPGGPLEGII